MDEKTVFEPASGGSVRRGARLNGIYEVETLVAQGGMGEVYQGFNIQTRDPVAIKMIRPDMSSHPDALALFRREASTLHNLQHDAIVRYFVFSVDPDLQRAYLAMEFVDGPSLTKRAASGPLPLAEVRILQERIGGALDAAHRLGVIHRDISSDNVILPGGDVRRAKIIDFGIARSQRPGEGTIIGDGFAGKSNYVSPEQLGLYGGDVTFKSDIYSFGLVLAEALRGRPIDMSGSQADVIEKRRSVPDLSDIDASMRPLIQAMLQPLPANRPASMAAVAAWGAGAGRRAPPPRASSARRVAAIGAALIALAGAGAIVYGFRGDLAQRVKPATAPLGPVAASSPVSSAAPTSPAPSPVSSSLPPPASPIPVISQTAIASLPGPTPEASAAPTPHVPTSQELVDLLPPRAPHSVVALPAATVGMPYHADLPAFADPGGHGLRLNAAWRPDGLTFKDRGDGRGEIEGAPTRAGTFSVLVTAVNHNGQTARMTATIVATLPPPAALPRPAAPTPTAALPPLVAPTPAIASPPVASPSLTVAPTPVAARPRPAAPTPFAALPPIVAPTPAIASPPVASPSLTVAATPVAARPRPAAPTPFAALPPLAAPTPATASPPVASPSLTVAATPVAARPRPAAPTPFAALPPLVAPTPTTASPPVASPSPTVAATPFAARPRPAAPTPFAALPPLVAPTPTTASLPVASPSPTVAPTPVVAQPRPTVPTPIAAPSPIASPPRPSRPQIVLEGAAVGADYSTALPPFNVGANARGLALRAEPDPPDGLAFADLGSGLSQISGKPARPGAFAFDIVATNGAGLSARMGVRIVVAAPPEPPAPTPEPNVVAEAPTPGPSIAAVAPATPIDKARAFIDGFDGGACFLIRSPPDAANERVLQGVGAELAPFQRFNADYTREVGVEPQLGLRLIAAPECPALKLIRLGSGSGVAALRIDLASYDVGRGKPLAGTVSRLAGRRLVLLLIDNDGVAHRLATKALPGGDSATFSVPLVADAESIGPLQIVIAIASRKPIAALETFRSAPLKDVASRLVGEAPASSAAVQAEFFKLVN